MKGKRASTFVMIAIVAVLMAIAILLINQPSIFQEGNPLPLLGGIWQISVEGKPYAEVKDKPPTYMTKTDDYDELFAELEKIHSVRFMQETDDGFLFEGDGGRLTVSSRQYSRSYRLWVVSDKK